MQSTPSLPKDSPQDGLASRALSSFLRGLGFFWRVVKETFVIYTRTGGEQSAAAFAYYALFSLVPLVALLLTLGSYILPKARVMTTIHRFVPIGDAQQDLLWNMVHGLEKARGSVSIVSILILTWASLRFFHALVLSVNHAWGTHHLPWWQMPVKNLALIFAMSGAMIIGTVVPAILQGIVRTLHTLEAWITLYFPMLDIRRLLAVVDLSRYIGGTLVLFYSFTVLYMLAPRHRPKFSQIWIPALLVSVLMQVGQAFFVNIVPKLINYSAIYGTMGGMMFLLLWVYIAGVMIICGGCLCAALAHQKGQATIHDDSTASTLTDHPNP